jgi:TrmH family RNA methyltransferase
MSLTKNEIKILKSLQTKRQREEDKLFVVEGEKMVSELYAQTKFKIKIIYFTEDYDVNLIPNTVDCQQISNKDLDRITGFKKANKVLAVVSQHHNTTLDYSENNLILVLDDVNDPGNLGTIIRTADWFGITQIIASKKTVELYNSKVIQSSMGAVYRMNYKVTHLAEEISELKQNGFQVSGAIINGENIYKTKLPTKTALIMGSESHGISDELLKLIDLEISIPNFGQTESLNVAMATGILLSEYKR